MAWMKKHWLAIVIPAAVVLLLVLAVLYVRFWRVTETELTLDDLCEPMTATQALLKLGSPDVGDSDNYAYFNRVTVEGITVEYLSVNFSEQQKDLFGCDYRLSMDYETSAKWVELLLEKGELLGNDEEYSTMTFDFEYEGTTIRLEVCDSDGDGKYDGEMDSCYLNFGV